ncbi:MAG: polysaccharide biosynthesis/export family protein [Chitinophagaceae bacterium]
MKPVNRSGLIAGYLDAIACTTIILLVVFASSCTTIQKISYFKDIPDSIFLAAKNIQTTNFEEPVIQPNDILQVSILTLDPQVNTVLTTSNTASYTLQPVMSTYPAGTSSVAGYLVDKNGMIEMPMIGKIAVSGMSSFALRELIHEKVSTYYNKAVVTVRIANFNITILGEVAKPAAYILPNEKTSILDAIGMAGDLTIHGKRENVLLIREINGQKQSVRFNLNSSKTFSSPYYYLRQGDIIYVEPTKSKAASTDTSKNRNIALLASGLSLLIVLFSRL